jgi:hypothetical protein
MCINYKYHRHYQGYILHHHHNHHYFYYHNFYYTTNSNHSLPKPLPLLHTTQNYILSFTITSDKSEEKEIEIYVVNVISYPVDYIKNKLYGHGKR